jgi:translation initiation factor IF-2
MSDSAQPKRLSKVAREFNLGLQTIIEFLSTKGFTIDSNPNSKIDAKQYKLLVDEFQSEKSLKERSEKVVVGKEKKETITLAPKEVPAVVEVKEEQIFKAERPKETFEVKVVGKIALEKETPAPAPTPAPKAKVKEEVAPKAAEPVAKVEEPVVEKEVPAPAPAVEAPAQEAVEEPKKAANAPDEWVRAKLEKLDGPKVIGKIELPVEKKHVPGSGNDFHKKKRERIKKGPVTGQQMQQQTPPSNNQQRTNNNNNNKGKKGGPPQKGAPKPEVTEDAIQRQIKETLARLSGGKPKNKAAKFRRIKRDEAGQRIADDAERAEQEKSILKVTEFISANELASLMDASVTEIISACMSLGLFVSINQRLDAETIAIVAEEFGFKVQFVGADVEEEEVEEVDENAIHRAPIVTVMGHVDHGKTSLLDYIRKENVLGGEAGGITQHIGAYSVTLKGGEIITFLDTPGHEAFTAMRARGAKVTDLAIIVIAADDAIMPQTVEAINHAQAAGVSMIFAINKIDKPGANPEKIKEQLAQMNILVEDWGGKFQCQHISAKKGLGIEELLDKVLIEAEMMGLKASPDRLAKGTVIESMLDKGRGYVATVLVQNGTMNVGDIILAGSFYGKIKAMYNERGKRVEKAGPSTPVQLLGLNGAPQAGDHFSAVKEEREAKDIATKRLQLQREQGIRTRKHITLDEIGRRIAIGDFQQLNIIVKGDVDGSIEALSDSLLKLSTSQIQINIIHKSVGQVSESDVLLASASNAIVIGFQVRPSAGARKLAEQEDIEIRLYSIIYKAIEELRDAMEGMLKPKIEEKVVANIEIREVFKITKVGSVAGCYVTDGKVTRKNKIRVIRDGIVIYSGELGSLKRFKEDVKEVNHGYECGLNVEKFNDIAVGDIIEAYEEVEVKQTLK